MAKKETIMLFSAHNDDQIIGAGGTLAKYARQGKHVVIYIFSFGESSHPHYREAEIIKTRVKEMQESDKILKVHESFFLGLKEGAFLKEFEEKKRKQVIVRAIKERKPTKIFLHSKDDPHPDHRAVNKIIREITKEMGYTGGLYSFDVWNPLKVRERNRAKLVVDISNTLQLKVKALKCHESQLVALASMLPSIYLRAIGNGLHYGYKFAETFTKIR